MRIQCPSCQARFKLADNKIPSDGVKVRCSRCKHVFRVKPESEAPVVRRASISDVHDVTLGPPGTNRAKRTDPNRLFASDDPFGGMSVAPGLGVPFAQGPEPPPGPISRHKRNKTVQGAAARNLLTRSGEMPARPRSEAVQALKRPGGGGGRPDPFQMTDPFEETQLPPEGVDHRKMDFARRSGPASRPSRRSGGGLEVLRDPSSDGAAPSGRRPQKSTTFEKKANESDPFAKDNLSGIGGFTAFFADDAEQQKTAVVPQRFPEEGHSSGRARKASARGDDPFSTQFPEQSQLGDIFSDPGQSSPGKQSKAASIDPFAALKEEEESQRDPFNLGGADPFSFDEPEPSRNSSQRDPFSLDGEPEPAPRAKPPEPESVDPFDFGTRDLVALQEETSADDGGGKDDFIRGNFFGDGAPRDGLQAGKKDPSDDSAAFFGGLDVPSSDTAVPPPDDFSRIPGLGSGDPSADGFGAEDGALFSGRRDALSEDDFNPRKNPELSSRTKEEEEEPENDPNDSFLGDRNRAMQFAPDVDGEDYFGSAGDDAGGGFFDPDRATFDPGAAPGPPVAPAGASKGPERGPDGQPQLRSVSIHANNDEGGAPAATEATSAPLPRPRATPDRQPGQFVAPSPSVSQIVVERQTSVIQTLANIALIVLILANGFLAFVAFKSGGTLDFRDLGSQVRASFGAPAAAPSPDAPTDSLGVEQVEQVDASNRDGKALFVLEGAVVNRSAQAFGAIAVEGVVLDAQGAQVAVSTAPVGRALTEEELLDVVDEGSLKGLYETIQEESNELRVGPSQAARFSVVFPGVDLAKAENYAFKVTISSKKEAAPAPKGDKEGAKEGGLEGKPKDDLPSEAAK